MVRMKFPATTAVGLLSVLALLGCGGGGGGENHAPVAQDVSATTPEGTPVSIALQASDSDGDTLTYGIVVGPSHGSLSGSGSQRTYAPSAGYIGTDTFTYRAYDGSDYSVAATVTITIYSTVNQAPQAQDVQAQTTEDVAIEVTLTASDPDGDTLIWHVDSGPEHGVLVGSAPSLSYRPDPNFHGIDGCTFHVNDGQADSNTATVELTVTEVNDPPVAERQTLSIPEDSYIEITLAASDVDGDPLTWTLDKAPSLGTLSGTMPDVTYTPDPDFNGRDYFRFRAHDGQYGSTATVLITVTPTNDAPLAQDVSVMTAQDTSVPVTLRATDIDGDLLNWSVDSAPQHGTLGGDAPHLTYIPDGGYTGADGFSFHASDGAADSNTATVTVTVYAATIWYVDVDAPAGGDGTSWPQAFQHPQEAVDAAVGGDDVWVAEGVYIRVSPSDQVLLTMKDGVAIFGGFAATETAFTERDPAIHITTLEGEDAARPVVVGASDACLDGFTVTGGNAEGGGFYPEDFGGGMFNENISNLAVRDCIFTLNSAYQGSGIFNSGTAGLVVSDCVFSSNTASSAGAGMSNWYGSSPAVVRCDFIANSADDGAGHGTGGAMRNYSNASPTLVDCLFENNQCAMGGAGMSNYQASPVLVNCTFRANQANGELGCGGGMTISFSGHPIISNCTFEDNYATQNGGGLTAGTDETIVDCLFTGNTAGFHAGGLSISDGGSVIGCTITGNSASLDGGGIYVGDSDKTISVIDCTVTGNAAAGNGGGVYDKSGYAVLTDCVVSGNAADGEGGGLYAWASNTLTNCTVTGNRAASNGGGISHRKGRSRWANCTLHGNSAGGSGGGIYNHDFAAPFVTNLIVWGNTASASPEVHVDVKSAVLVTYSNVGGTGAYPGYSNLNVDPLFVSPGYWDDNGTPADPTDDFWVDGDYHLLPASPCIDAGTRSGAPGADIEGSPRPRGGGWDLGAYEYQENHAPVALDRSVSTAEETPLAITLTATDADGDALTWTVDAAPAHGTLAGTDPDLVYDPDAGYTGPDSFTFHVDDGTAASNTATVDIVVAKVWYVDLDATGAADGSSWADAFAHPQDAMDVAAAGDEVWVAEGAYAPRAPTDGVLLSMKDGVRTYGGFAGTESALAGRDMTAHVTVLDGESQVFHVIVGASNSRIDGFTVAGGDANGGAPDDSGGGLYNDAAIGLEVANCVVKESSAAYGAGMYNLNCSPTVENCVFYGNVASVQGGAVYNNGGSPQLASCTFSLNSAGAGGGIYNALSSSPTLTSCVMWADAAGTGPEIHGDGTGGATVCYSDVEGGHPGTDNIDGDPLFVDAAAGNLRLQSSSPCIDAGTGAGTPRLDIEGVSRPKDAGYDMGAHEFHAGNRIYVKHDAAGANDGSSWVDAFATVQDAMAAASAGDEVWVAGGIYTRRGFDLVVLNMKDGVGVYGGFAGTERARAQRDPSTELSVLDGGHVANHVVKGAWDARLDGFVLTGGFTDDSYIPSGYGGAMLNREIARLIVADCIFTRNEARSGGGICNYHTGSVTVVGCTFTCNLATWNNAGGGGGIYNVGSSPTVADCTFSRNAAYYSGAGIANDQESSPEVSGCVFSLNADTAMNNEDGSSPTVTDCVFENNEGNGMSNYDFSSPQVTNCTFRGNTGIGMGSAWNSDATVAECTFEGNVLRGMGISSSSPVVSRCTFASNTTDDDGAGVHIYDASPRIEDCVFIDNSAFDSGGGMRIEGSGSPVILNCTFAGNSADAAGAISCTSPAAIRNCAFRGNRAARIGGGMTCTSSSPAEIVNCLFVGNSAEEGGGIWAAYSSPAVTNCTFSGNRASVSGGGFSSEGSFSTPVLKNCILWSDSAPTGQEVHKDGGGSISVAYSDVEQGGYAGTNGNISGNPSFVSPGYWDDNLTPADPSDDLWIDGDYHLQVGSPCVDAGTSEGAPDEDIEGTSRPQLDGHDMGAYEYQ